MVSKTPASAARFLTPAVAVIAAGDPATQPGRSPTSRTIDERVARELATVHGATRRALDLLALGKLPVLDARMVAELFDRRFTGDEIDALVVARRTLARRLKDNQPLSEDESNRAFRLERIVAQADRVFGSPDLADAWLRDSHSRFGGQSPLSMLRSEPGARAVEELLGQIDYGIYS
jgi:putative toxin-antitoxin system antitoxin component (TIGR02293 family)